LQLHSDLNVTVDAQLKDAAFDKATGAIVAPPRSTVVYFEPQ
jgi:hypothetical protein